MNPGYEPVFPMTDEGGTPYWGLSLRQYAAIHLRQPISNVPWLDDAIRAARREAIAAHAATQMRYEDDAVERADALIAKLEGKP